MTRSRAPLKQYPPELRERAVRMVQAEIEARGGNRFGVVGPVAEKLGIGVESLRQWVRQADIDAGRKGGTTTTDRQRIVELERENKELRRANEILKSAAVFFGAELDRRHSR